MSLFINAEAHPNLFMNTNRLQAPNQAYYQYDTLSEWKKEQHNINESITESIRKIKVLYNLQEISRQRSEEAFAQQLETYRVHYGNFKSDVLERLAMLEESEAQLKQLLEEETVLNKQARKQITEIHQSNKKLLHELHQFQDASKTVSAQVDACLSLQKQTITQLSDQSAQYEHISEELKKQADDQQQVQTKLQNQEALVEKALRQLDHIRSVLYERSSYLAEKVESGYDRTASYVYHLLTKSEKPYTFFLQSNKKENKE
ncbi:hypothetical protein ACLIBH_05715 [Virgibacillus sp. W0430]|uniref:hypothetical protein n=1 Tax=Virgibacillus sp. W0430 TaxID=3391580 RepID=UPI003F454EDC